MAFTSLGFLLFFPVVCLVCFVLPRKAREGWLLGASYYFVFCAMPAALPVLLGVTALGYCGGRWLGAARRKRLALGLLIAAAAAVLGLFKYADFALDTLAALAHLAGIGGGAPSLGLLLPVGLSFYIFQTIGYLVDVYRGDQPSVRSLARYALFIAFFPQLVSGPIARAPQLLPQLAEPGRIAFCPDRVRDGLLRMLWGYFEKLVIADRAALVVNTVFGDYAAYGGVERLAAALLYTLQIYADFAGYSDIAIGAAQLLGLDLQENFRRPYFARTIRDFWARWHISLSRWLRDYLYIPLGGNRKGALRKQLNLLVTFLVSGLWHGAAWHYVAWGGLHAAYQIAGNLTAPLRRQFGLTLGQGFLARWAQRVFTLGLVTVAWVFFRADSIRQALSFLGGIAGWFDPWALTDGSMLALGLDAAGWFVLFCAVLVLFGVDALRERGVPLRRALARQPLVYRWAVYYAAVFAVIVFGVWGPGYAASAFVYFQF